MADNKKTPNPFDGELFNLYERAFNYLVKKDKKLVTLLQSKVPSPDPEYKAIIEKIVEHRKKVEAFADTRRKIISKYKRN